MDTNLFLQQFGYLAESPKGIQKLRGLVLELAVRGKLSEQNPADEPVSELLKRIEMEKRQLIKAGAIKELEVFPPVDENEKIFGLVQRWEYIRLGSVVQNVRGITFPASAKESYSTQENIACLRTTNIQQEVEWDDLIYVSQNYVNNPEKIVQVGDVLISLANSRELVGKTAIVRSIPVDKATLGGFIGAIRPFIISSEYVNYFLTSASTRKYFIIEASQTTNLANISTGKLNFTPFAMPPLAEQHRIVAKVDELMQLCDQLEAEQAQREHLHESAAKSTLFHLSGASSKSEALHYWQQAEQHFSALFDRVSTVEELRATILQLAVQGRLVPQNPDDEPASVLLERIEAEKQRLIKAGEIKKSDKLPPITDDEKPYELPNGWEWVRMQNIFDVRDGTHDTPKYVVGDGVPLITSKDFSNGRISFENARLISFEDHLIIKKRSSVERDDILFSMIGGNIGNQVLVATDKEFSIKNVALYKYYAKDLTLPRYLKRFLEKLAETLQKSASGGAQPFVSLSYLRNILFPLPPLPEQHRIVAKVDELMQLCDQIEEEATQSRELSAKLMDSILYHLFEPV